MGSKARLALPKKVAAALDSAPSGRRRTITAAGIPFSAIRWGDQFGRPLLLLHGVTASAAIWWRIGPALAATGRHVVAVDLPGHGLTGHWVGHHRFRDNAADLAAFTWACGLVRPGLQVVGHSWGAMTAAALPMAGIDPDTLVLLEPPTVSLKRIAGMVKDFEGSGIASTEDLVEAIRSSSPDWSDGDVRAAAEALAQVDPVAARSIVLENGDWDGGLADLADPAAAATDVWVIRGDPSAGGYVPDRTVRAIGDRVGGDHLITLEGAPHAPQRTHPVETTAALLRALDG